MLPSSSTMRNEFQAGRTEIHKKPLSNEEMQTAFPNPMRLYVQQQNSIIPEAKIAIQMSTSFLMLFPNSNKTESGEG